MGNSNNDPSKTITATNPNTNNRKSVTKLKTTGNKITVSTMSTASATSSTPSSIITQLNGPAGGLNAIADAIGGGGGSKRKNDSAAVAVAATTVKVSDDNGSFNAIQSSLSTTTITNNNSNSAVTGKLIATANFYVHSLIFQY